MQEDTIIQKNLFAIDNENNEHKELTKFTEDLSWEDLKKESQNRPRQRKNSTNLINKFNHDLISNNKNICINEKSFSYKTVSKLKLTPVMKHYVTLKEKNEDRLLLYRLGDFFECFFEDAVLVSNILEITLTSKDAGKEIGKIPMAGVPHHAMERYCADLIKKNYSVVICDQLEKSSGNYGTPIKRGITRIITPGTVIEEGMLIAKKNNWITAIYLSEEKSNESYEWGISKADVSTGELITMEGQSLSKLFDEIINLDSSEIIVGSNEVRNLLIKGNDQISYTVSQETTFGINEANYLIKKYFNLASLEGIGLKNLNNATRSLGGLLNYLEKINPSNLDKDSCVRISLDFPQIQFCHNKLIIDYQTKKNLEIKTTQRENNYVGSLLWSIDRTFTCMGARCLRRWIDSPLLNVNEIYKRQNIISNFVESKQLRLDTQNLLRAMGDLERLAGRTCAGHASPRDLIAIAEGLKKLPRLKSIIELFKYDLPDWTYKLKNIDEELLKLADTISFKLIENPPLNISEGGIIHDGVDNILDGLRNLMDDYSEWLNKEELKEKKISKISNLKIQFHKNFGYYISINKSKVNLAPQHWIKRQTLTNEERYITSEIKNKENKIFQIKNRASSREYEIFCELRKIVSEKTKQIRSIAKSIASLDALLGLSITSVENNFIKPSLIPINDSLKKNCTKIIAGRNPIVEQLLNNKKFVENDIYFNHNQRLIILTGPNASGKSCFIRQIGLIQILAQIGSFIPANNAEIKISDRIFTRIGAVDDQSSGQSTFMVEMSETASILNQATSSSLVLLDEIGRGTSTFDGLSIAWSVSEYLAQKIKCNTIFATHYHELNYLKNSNKNIENFQVLVEQSNDQLIFSHRIVKGGSNKSYGIEAAKLAGVPIEVIEKAKSVLNSLEKNNKFNTDID
ncbi:DNA mismatch repair protein MutS [Prochlorococcus marinus XMU1406]|uniref:DNA mismatch repair protein MutS n=1 Tax=Prochlorococcus marinus TaxID=1219 RepID=UPI001ADB253A|nr:DNA mismatch repair protein MutS [Prochlorococcus marinus]MBO8207236.1 DNA mismatch repair protein MutS [Prochlorococcus marinus XMU1406]MCR8543051.1 DNA mismatch repair protein MutS [Prochlorococcus marinus XMU1427]